MCGVSHQQTWHSWVKISGELRLLDWVVLQGRWWGTSRFHGIVCIDIKILNTCDKFILVNTRFSQQTSLTGELWGVCCEFSLIYVLPQPLQCCMEYHVILYHSGISLYLTLKTIAIGDLAIWGARASAAMVLSYLTWNISTLYLQSW